MQTSHSKTSRGFRSHEITAQEKRKEAKKRKPGKRGGRTCNNEIKIIKATGDRYEDLKKVEPLLRIHAQANSNLQETYKGLYVISTKEKKQLEAIKWGKEWIKHKPSTEREGWTQAQIANKLKNLDSLEEITKSLISFNSSKSAITLQWCINQYLIAEEWEKAAKAIKKLKRMGAENEITRAQEAMCIIETKEITPRERINQINQLGFEEFSSKNKIYEIIKLRCFYETGTDPKTLKIRESTQKVNRHGVGIERLLIPILMNLNQNDQGIKICEELIKINPSATQLRQLYGECLLRKGEWRTGFKEKTAQLEGNSRATNTSNTSIFCDGTLGETLFFSRWLSYWAQKNPGKTVYVQQPLLKLLEYNFRNIRFQPIKSTYHHEKLRHLPIALLPTYLKDWEGDKTIFEFSLKTEEWIARKWRELLKKDQNEKLIAINWHGPALKSIIKPSESDINLECFSCFTELSNIRLVSLQKGMGRQELKKCSFKHYFHEEQDLIDRENRIEHIAGIILNCDAVICDDSGPAHLSSNLGKQTIINARGDCSWLWHQDQQKSLRFYPKTKTSQFSNNWEETVQKGMEKLNLL